MNDSAVKVIDNYAGVIDGGKEGFDVMEDIKQIKSHPWGRWLKEMDEMQRQAIKMHHVSKYFKEVKRCL